MEGRGKPSSLSSLSHTARTWSICPLWSISLPLHSLRELQIDNGGAAEDTHCTSKRSYCLWFNFSASFHPLCCPTMSNTEQAKGSRHFCATPRAVFSLTSRCDPHFCGYMRDLYPSRLSLPHPPCHLHWGFCKALLNLFPTPALQFLHLL